MKTIGINLKEFTMEKKIGQKEITSMNFSRRFEYMVVTNAEGYKLIDPETLDVIDSFKTAFPMNCAQISPLMTGEPGQKPHVIVGGGVQARDIALAKEGGLDI